MAAKERKTGATRKRRFSRPEKLAAALPGVVRPAFARFGFSQSAILTRWPMIVGPVLARHAIPERIVHRRKEKEPATLHLRVDGGFATELQHLEPLVLERINSFYGYKAIGRLAIKQGPVNRVAPATRRQQRPLTADETAQINALVSGARDERLRQSLRTLGESIFAAMSRPQR